MRPPGRDEAGGQVGSLGDLADVSLPSDHVISTARSVDPHATSCYRLTRSAQAPDSVHGQVPHGMMIFMGEYDGSEEA